MEAIFLGLRNAFPNPLNSALTNLSASSSDAEIVGVGVEQSHKV